MRIKKTKKEKIFNVKNVSALARYVEKKPITIYVMAKTNPKMHELIKLGWAEKCKNETT
jgi:hypothetical protein